jgi:hypothetical protein
MIDATPPIRRAVWMFMKKYRPLEDCAPFIRALAWQKHDPRDEFLGFIMPTDAIA